MSDHIEDNEDNEFDYESIKDCLAECLNKVHNAGSFALFRGMKPVPNPGLVIGDTGIGLPLSNNDARTFILASHPVPPVQGTESVVGLQAKNTWELTAGEFRAANPDWHHWLCQILSNIQDGLGLTAAGKTFKADICKLLLHEEGAVFQPHQDSEKAPGMFGTLVIVLPSKHEGGEFHLSYGGQKKILETSTYSDFDCSYLVWFSDVVHEVKPIISGRRLVLTYNLIQTTPGEIETASSRRTDLHRLRSILSWWRRYEDDDPDEFPRIMAYMLENHYPDASLSYNSLKGKDMKVAYHLQGVAAEEDVFFCLANVTRTVKGDVGYPEYDGWGHDDSEDEDVDENGFHTIENKDVLEDEISLEHVADLDGTEIDGYVYFEEDHIVQKGVFDDMSPNDEEFDKYTREATQSYHITVALLMPRSHRVRFILHQASPAIVKKWLNSLARDHAAQPEPSEQTVQEIKDICNLVLKQTRKWATDTPVSKDQPYPDAILVQVFSFIVVLKDTTLFAEAYVACIDKLHLPEFGFVESVLVESGMLDSLPKILSDAISNTCSTKRWAVITRFMKSALATPNRNASQHEAIRDWCDHEANRLLFTGKLFSATNGEMICDILKVCKSSLMVTEAVKANMNHTKIAISFLNALIDNENQGILPKIITRPVFASVIAGLAQYFEPISTGKLLKDLAALDKLSDISTLMCYCHSWDLESELDQLITKFCETAAEVETSLLDTVFPSLLKGLIDALRKQSIAIAGSPFRSMFQNILNTYIRRYVMPEPKADDWSRDVIVCATPHCTICPKFDDFLSSGTRRECRVSLPNRTHQDHASRAIRNKDCVTDRQIGNRNIIVARKRQISQDHALWEKRFNHAKKKIGELGLDMLKELLEECYDFITTLAAVRRIVPSAVGHVQPASIARLSRPGALGPSSTPGSQRQQPSYQGNSAHDHHSPYGNIGRVAAAQPPPPGQSLPPPPPPPAWLMQGLENLHQRYRDDSFAATMTYTAIDVRSNTLTPAPPPGQPIPPNIKWFYLPRIRCHDCPGKLYTPGPSTTVDNFEVHLKNRAHRDRVIARKDTGSSASGSRPPLSTINNKAMNAGPPSLPSWFNTALTALQKQYPEDMFRGEMKHMAKNIHSGRLGIATPGVPLPENFESVYILSVVCCDCPGKSFWPDPGLPLDTFESHLKDKEHRDRVATRIGKNTIRSEDPTAQGQSSGSGSSIAVDKLRPLPPNRKRAIEMIDITGDSD